MTTADRINKTLPQLGAPFQQEVLDFVEFLLQKAEKSQNGRKNETPNKKAESIEQWAKSHRYDTPVILDDRREIIYED